MPGARYLIFLFVLSYFAASGQHNLKTDTVAVSMIGGHYSFSIPGGDLAKRFGDNSAVGGSFYRKTSSNLLWGIEYSYLFGNIIRENGILDSISTKEPAPGYLINGTGQFQVFHTYERGQIATFKIGKIFPVIGPNVNSGIMLKLGAGYLEHRIKYYWTGHDGPPQLSGDYYKGYDRLTSGLCLTQDAGILFLGSRNNYNFSIELEALEGFTRSRRSWDFDLQIQDTKNRLDLLFGAKATWFFPVYHKSSDGYYQ